MKKLIVVLLAFSAYIAQAQGPATDKPADEGYVLKVNDKAADFSVQLLDGTSVTLSSLKSKVVLINFWATWCQPCMKEFNELPSQILSRFKDKDFVFLAISRGEEKKLVEKKMKELRKKGIDFNPGLDPDKSIWSLYGTAYIPKNFLLDQNGVIRYVSTGYGENKVAELAREIEKMLVQ